jgi:hypothetical protein
MVRWLHHLFQPHCRECLDELHEKNRCEVCEELRSILNNERHEKKQLLDAIIAYVDSKNLKPELEPTTIEPVLPRIIPWRVKQQILEEQSRREADIRRQQREEEAKANMNPVSIEQLEKELAIAGTSSSEQ